MAGRSRLTRKYLAIVGLWRVEFHRGVLTQNYYIDIIYSACRAGREGEDSITDVNAIPARTEFGRVDAWAVLLQILLVSTVGLVVAPALFGGPARVGPPGLQNEPAGGLLVVGLLASVWLIRLGHALVRLAEAALFSVEVRLRAEAPMAASTAARHFALWSIVFLEIVLIQAMLRPSLVILLSGTLSPDDGEGLLAALTLIPLFLLLNRMYRSARPLVESIARSFLDLLIASPDADAIDLASPTVAMATQQPSVPLDQTATSQTSSTYGTGAGGEDTSTQDPEAETDFTTSEGSQLDFDARRGGETLIPGGGL